jgi:integrase
MQSVNSSLQPLEIPCMSLSIEDNVFMWEYAAARWLREQSHKASIHSDRLIINWLSVHLSGLQLARIDKETINRLIDLKSAEGVSNATVNRMLALLRAVLRRAATHWELLERAPQFRLLREPSRRVRFLTRDEAERLISELPEHLADMAVFSLSTGLRASNVTGLQWSQVNLEQRLAWIHADQAKSRRSLAVPLNRDAVAIVAKQRDRHPLYVFTYRGKPVLQVSTAAWYNALKRAGITDFRWHDLRHTWASWHVQNGTPLNALQELGGWESASMVRRYAHFSVGHLSNYADSLARFQA